MGASYWCWVYLECDAPVPLRGGAWLPGSCLPWTVWREKGHAPATSPFSNSLSPSLQLCCLGCSPVNQIPAVFHSLCPGPE